MCCNFLGPVLSFNVHTRRQREIIVFFACLPCARHCDKLVKCTVSFNCSDEETEAGSWKDTGLGLAELGFKLCSLAPGLQPPPLGCHTAAFRLLTPLQRWARPSRATLSPRSLSPLPCPHRHSRSLSLSFSLSLFLFLSLSPPFFPSFLIYPLSQAPS